MNASRSSLPCPSPFEYKDSDKNDTINMTEINSKTDFRRHLEYVGFLL